MSMLIEVLARVLDSINSASSTQTVIINPELGISQQIPSKISLDFMKRRHTYLTAAENDSIGILFGVVLMAKGTIAHATVRTARKLTHRSINAAVRVEADMLRGFTSVIPSPILDQRVDNASSLPQIPIFSLMAHNHGRELAKSMISSAENSEVLIYDRKGILIATREG